MPRFLAEMRALSYHSALQGALEGSERAKGRGHCYLSASPLSLGFAALAFSRLDLLGLEQIDHHARLIEELHKAGNVGEEPGDLTFCIHFGVRRDLQRTKDRARHTQDG